MAYSPQTSTFGPIALSIQRRLNTELEIDLTYLPIVATDSYELVNLDDKQIYIRVYGPSPSTNAGAGRRFRPTARMVRLYLYLRRSSDRAGDDTLALTDDTEGMWEFEEQVADVLDDWFPLNEDESELLTIEPLHPSDSTGPPERKPEDDIGVIRSSLLYEVNYGRRVNVDVP